MDRTVLLVDPNTPINSHLRKDNRFAIRNHIREFKTKEKAAGREPTFANLMLSAAKAKDKDLFSLLLRTEAFHDDILDNLHYVMQKISTDVEFASVRKDKLYDLRNILSSGEAYDNFVQALIQDPTYRNRERSKPLTAEKRKIGWEILAGASGLGILLSDKIISNTYISILSSGKEQEQYKNNLDTLLNSITRTPRGFAASDIDISDSLAAIVAKFYQNNLNGIPKSMQALDFFIDKALEHNFCLDYVLSNHKPDALIYQSQDEHNLSMRPWHVARNLFLKGFILKYKKIQAMSEEERTTSIPKDLQDKFEKIYQQILSTHATEERLLDTINHNLERFDMKDIARLSTTTPVIEASGLSTPLSDFLSKVTYPAITGVTALASALAGTIGHTARPIIEASKTAVSGYVGYVDSALRWAANAVSSVPGIIASATIGNASAEDTSHHDNASLPAKLSDHTLAAHVTDAIGTRPIKDRVQDHAGIAISEGGAKALATLTTDLPGNLALAAVLLRIGLNTTNAALQYIGLQRSETTTKSTPSNKLEVFNDSLQEIRKKLSSLTMTTTSRELLGKIDSLLEQNKYFIEKVAEIKKTMHVKKSQRKDLDKEYAKFIKEYEETIIQAVKVIKSNEPEPVLERGPYSAESILTQKELQTLYKREYEAKKAQEKKSKPVKKK